MSYLIDSSSLNQAIAKGTVTIVNVKMVNPVNGQADSEEDGYIPDAVVFDIDGDGSDHSGQFPHTLPSVDDFTSYLGRLGITPSSDIVVYDNSGMFCAPRLWWMLKSIGHNNVKVLNGGLPAWKSAGFPVVAEPKSGITHLPYQPGKAFDGFVFLAQMQENLTNASYQVIDARASQRYLGQAAEPRAGVRSGHIPGSLNLPFTDLLAEGEFLSKDKLTTRFLQAGVELDKPIVCSCGSGITACVIALAATEVGISDIAIYDGSWSEWGSIASLPLETQSNG